MKCSRCSVSNVKLWRKFQTIARDLYCVDCTAHFAKVDPASINDRGQIKWRNESTYCVGFFVPAIRDEKDGFFWGFLSVPSGAIKKWESLPLRKEVICTIGSFKSYRDAYFEYGHVTKMGRRGRSKSFPNGYPGGYVFRHLVDAVNRIEEAYMDRDFAVFGLKTSWSNTYKAQAGASWNNLIEDADIHWPPRIMPSWEIL